MSDVLGEIEKWEGGRGNGGDTWEMGEKFCGGEYRV